MKRTLTCTTIALMAAGLAWPAVAQVDPQPDAQAPVAATPESTDKTADDGGKIEGAVTPLPIEEPGESKTQTADQQPPGQGSIDTDAAAQLSPAAAPARQDTAGLIDLDADSSLLGTKVRDRAGDRIGTVRDVVPGPDGSPLIVVEVGGFLGFFGRDVAFTQAQLTLGADGSLRTPLSEAEIDAMPEYEARS